jgi:hypothetical protein
MPASLEITPLHVTDLRSIRNIRIAWLIRAAKLPLRSRAGLAVTAGTASFGRGEPVLDQPHGAKRAAALLQLAAGLVFLAGRSRPAIGVGCALQRGRIDASAASKLRMLRSGSAAGFARRDDLFLRVHLLPELRRNPVRRSLPEL